MFQIAGKPFTYYDWFIISLITGEQPSGKGARVKCNRQNGVSSPSLGCLIVSAQDVFISLEGL